LQFVCSQRGNTALDPALWANRNHGAPFKPE
jgi:hypothetical protein